MNRVATCSSLDLCYDYERHNPEGVEPHDIGDDTICGDGETCAIGVGPDGRTFHVCVLAMYCEMSSGPIYRKERTSVEGNERFESVAFSCPNIKQEDWEGAGGECSKVQPLPEPAPPVVD